MKMMFHIRYIGRKEVKIEQYCGARGRGGALGTLKSYKDNGAPSVIKIVKYCGGWGSGWGALWGVKILQQIMASPLSVIKIVKYCGVWGSRWEAL